MFKHKERVGYRDGGGIGKKFTVILRSGVYMTLRAANAVAAWRKASMKYGRVVDVVSAK